MLTNLFAFLDPKNIQQNLPDILSALAADLDRIRNGTGPTDIDLATAPTLTGWRSAMTPMGVRLTGTVDGHPRLGNSFVMTTQLWAADPDGKWVRTMSRFYRLGAAFRPAPNDGDEDASDFEGGL